jgi:hypothetical protein
MSDSVLFFLFPLQLSEHLSSSMRPCFPSAPHVPPAFLFSPLTHFFVPLSTSIPSSEALRRKGTSQELYDSLMIMTFGPSLSLSVLFGKACG